MSLYETSHKRVFLCWVYVKLLKGRVFCCSSMNIKLWQVSSSPVSLKGFLSCAIYRAFLSSSLPSTPDTFRGCCTLFSGPRTALYNSPLQSLAALIILSSPHHVTSNVALASAKQPANAPSPSAAMPSSPHGTAQPDYSLTSASSSTCLSHIFAALPVSDPFSCVWQMLWIVLESKAEGHWLTWLSKFSLILLFWAISRDYSREKLEGIVDSIISCRMYCPLYFPNALPLIYFFSSISTAKAFVQTITPSLLDYHKADHLVLISSPIQRDIFLKANLITSVIFFKILTLTSYFLGSENTKDLQMLFKKMYLYFLIFPQYIWAPVSCKKK